MLATLPASAGANHSALGELMSLSPLGGNAEEGAFFRGSSQDGQRVFIETAEALVAADADDCIPDIPGLQGCTDLYERTNGVTTLLSVGTGTGNGAFGANYAGASQDGTKVFFTTREQLIAGDTDASIDIYQRSGGVTTLISTGPAGGNGAKNSLFDRATPDGARVVFHTSESLVSTDTDSSTDVYERNGSTTTLLSTGPSGGNGAFAAPFKGASQDGTRIFFETSEKLTSDDTDSQTDVYERAGGVTTRLSLGPFGGNGNGVDEFFDATWVGASQSGTRVFFETDEALVDTDLDIQYDVYERSGGVTSLLSTGPAGGNGEFDASFRGSSADGTRVFFQTSETIVGGDGDSVYQDVYQRQAGVTTLISTGPSDTNLGVDASFAGSSSDGARVFITTALQLTSADTDAGWRDIYERNGSTTTLLSTGPTDPHGSFNAIFAGATVDASRLFFVTWDALVASDGDSNQQDVYERTGTTTTLLSIGPDGGNDPLFGASFAGASADGTRVFLHSGETLVSEDTDASQDVYAAIVNVLFPRPGGGSPLRVPLVPAFKQCTVPNAIHAAPLNLLSCMAPAVESNQLTVSTSGRAQGFARLETIVGSPSTPENEADLNFDVSLSDVRNKTDGTDYTGKVILTTALRVTDRANGTSRGLSGTPQDAQLSAPIDCVSTADVNQGSTCSVNTTANALVPGLLVESRRSVMSAFSMRVLDAGLDGSVAPTVDPLNLGCPPTCGSGDEKPFFAQGLFTP